MGGRGASSGISKKGNKYGSQYNTIRKKDKKPLQVGNIKFIAKNNRQSETLMETMTEGRVYVTVAGKNVLRITMFDKNNQRNKVIEKDHRTGKWHVHHGYLHREYSEKKHDPLTQNDKALLDKVLRIWKNDEKG